ncbi:MAG: adenylyl-sulfate kinase [Ferruginibacter sp.]
MLIQLTGLSGAGKTTISLAVKKLLEANQLKTEIIDGDTYRKTLCSDLGFSAADRQENIRRLGALAHTFSKQGIIAIIAAINPFEIIRNELKEKYAAKTIWIRCDMKILLQRDTKGLYKRAALPEGHPDKLSNLTGVNDIYDLPYQPDLMIDSGTEDIDDSVNKLYQFILGQPTFI